VIRVRFIDGDDPVTGLPDKSAVPNHLLSQNRTRSLSRATLDRPAFAASVGG
jgi:hypothetical protein